MRKIYVQVKDDHLENLGKTRPLNAIIELIWNSLDADAKNVQVKFIENDLGGLDYIDIIDDGHGLLFEDALIAFSNLGGSWKKDETVTRKEKRILHGKYGKGRFKAFSLGGRVTWHSTYEKNGILYHFYITGNFEDLTAFEVSEPNFIVNESKTTGMHVRIAMPWDNAHLIRGTVALDEVTDVFAPYLFQYPHVKIIYDGVVLDPSNALESQMDYTFSDVVAPSGRKIDDAILTVIEWSSPGRRGLFFCDENGFTRYIPLPKLHFRGFSYSAYFKSAYIRELDKQGLLQTDELHEDVRFLIQLCKKKLREHFILREAEKSHLLIQEWKDEGIYPIPKEIADRQNLEMQVKIFEIYATHLFLMVKELNDLPKLIQQLILQLIYSLVVNAPMEVPHILNQIISLPEEKETEIQRLIPL